MNLKYLSQRGSILMNLLIMIPLIGFMAISIANLIAGASSQLSALGQQLEAREMEALLEEVFANQDNCLQAFGGQSMNLSGVTASNPLKTAFTVNELRIGGPNGLLLAKVGEKLNMVSSSLVVESISVSNITPTSNPDEYSGSLRISFDRQSERAPIRAVEVRRLFNMNPSDPVNAKKIAACSTEGTIIAKGCFTRIMGPGNSYTCTGGEKVLSCSGLIETTSPVPLTIKIPGTKGRLGQPLPSNGGIQPIDIINAVGVPALPPANVKTEIPVKNYKIIGGTVKDGACRLPASSTQASVICCQK